MAVECTLYLARPLREEDERRNEVVQEVKANTSIQQVKKFNRI